MTAAERAHAQKLATFTQNWEMFRSLNSLMWQIPVIAMTLTGGLWFGVAKSETAPVFQLSLLFLAAAGDLGLAIVLYRLRHIMEHYLQWLKAFDAAAFVEAPAAGWRTQPQTVRRVFQIMLGLATTLSVVLMAAPAWQIGRTLKMGSPASITFYDRQALDLADTYEALPFEATHPDLLPLVVGKPGIRILDVGAGSGRDAAWLAMAGHSVTAVEPSDGMLRLAKRVHPDVAVRWHKDALPALASLKPGEQFDLIILSAVWMHVLPRDRAAAFARLETLRAPGGQIYVTLRSGPAEPERQVFPTSIEELRRFALRSGLRVVDHGERPDLLGRSGVTWRAASVVETTTP